MGIGMGPRLGDDVVYHGHLGHDTLPDLLATLGRDRVVADDTNREPLPTRLSGRVLSGLSTTIPFDGFGMDPDGDVVRLDRIVTQPTHGSAVISADGTSIVYTSLAGTNGQDSFTYRVVDPQGREGGRIEIEAPVVVLSAGAVASPALLLASGLASTAVGAYAGAEIMQGLLRVRVPLLARRLVTLVPAVALLAAGVGPRWIGAYLGR